MNNRKVILVLISAFMISALIATMPVQAVNGPRADLQYLYYTSPDAAWIDLNLGKIDLYADMLTTTQYGAALTNPNITVTPRVMTGREWHISYNANYTALCNQPVNVPEMLTWKGIQLPSFDTNFRKAMACTADVAGVIAGVWLGLGYKMDVPLRKSTQDNGWANESLVDAMGGHFPYNYNLTKARWYLQQTGIEKTGKPEDGWYDYDNDTIVNFPLDWPGVAGTIGVRDEPNIKQIPFWCYDSPPEREGEVKNFYIPAMNSVLGPNIVTLQIRTRAFFDSYIWSGAGMDAIFYTDGWSTGQGPTGLYSYFIQSEWMNTNTYTGGNYNNDMKMPWTDEVDAAENNFYYAPNLTEAQKWCKYVQYLVVDKYCFWLTWGINVEGFYAYRNLIGVVTSPNYGPDNFYSNMNWMRVDDPKAPIRIGTYSIPANFNPWVSQWAASRSFVYCWDPHQYAVNNPYAPWDRSMWAGCGAQRDWADPVETWVDPYDSVTKGVTVYYLNKEAKWVEPLTGNVLYPVNYSDYAFSWMYWIQTKYPSFYSGGAFRAAEFIRPGTKAGAWDYSVVKAYLGNPDYYLGLSLWDADAMWLTRGLCRSAWKKSPFVTGPITKVYVEGVNITTPGFAKTGVAWRASNAPVELISVVGDDGAGNVTTLPQFTTSDVNYEMKFDIALSWRYYPYIYYKFAPGTKITLTYWGRGTYDGNTPGGQPLEKTLYGSGPFYLLSYDINIGFSWKRNTNYKLEQPPYGETDWTWYWEGTTKPRGGYMQIKIYDVVKIATAYGAIGSRFWGTFVPSPNWVTSADVAATSAPGGGVREGKIDIFDVVSATGKYMQKFWVLPPP